MYITPSLKYAHYHIDSDHPHDFKNLTLLQKIATIALTIIVSLATLFLFTSVVFRSLVNHFKAQNPVFMETPEEMQQKLYSQFEKLESYEAEGVSTPDALDKKYSNFLPYLFNFMTNLTEGTLELQNDDELTIRNGSFVKAGGDNPDAESSYGVIFYMLKRTYGQSLIEKVFIRYGLNRKNSISLKDLKQIMVGVATNVRESDLRDLFNHIKLNHIEEPGAYFIKDVLQKADGDLYQALKNKESFEQLSPEELNFLHSAFKTVPFKNERLMFSKLVNDLIKDTPSDHLLYRHDIKAMELKETWNCLDLEHPTLALGEFAGKSLIYQELKPGLIVPMPGLKEGSTTARLYKVDSSLEDKNDAVIAHILSPLNEQQDIYGDGSEHAFLGFRGTLPNSSSKAGGASIFRDLHYRGIGKTTYDAREEEIKAMIVSYLARCPGDNVTLHLSGHSLGGCDTQRATTTLMELVASAKEGSPLKKLKKVVVTTFNAPLVDANVNARLKQAVRTIKEKDIDIDVELNHVRFFDQSNEDIIQKFGSILLGADYHGGTGGYVFKNNPRFKRNIIKIHVQQNLGIGHEGNLARHSYRTFNKALFNIPYVLTTLSADIEEERKIMEREMAGNYHWNEQEMSAFGKVIHSIYWFFTAVLRGLLMIPHALFTAIHGAVLGIFRLMNVHAHTHLDRCRVYS